EQQNTNDRSKEKTSTENEDKKGKSGDGAESDAQNKQSGESQEGEKQQGSGGQQGGQQDEQSGGQNGQKSGGETEKKKLAAANTVVVYGGDENEAVMLDPLATRGIVWQDTHSDFGLVELRNMQLDGADVPAVSARLTGKKVTLKADRVGGENVFTYRIKVKLRLDDSKICSNPLFYNQWKNTLEQMYESVIQNNIMQAVAASKESNVDFLGIREYFHKFCRKGFDTFDLQSVTVKVNANVTIQT
ncbi:MAG: Ger(x)C family spore germination C-terminal domain-containing protein, partial [Clostridiales bacterium]|nr:Ger(x)C family spore germination C-terminal domain-containing protein [Clostridiales bacterium]